MASCRGAGPTAPPDEAASLARLLPQQAAVLFAASAVLGPLCDGLHSKADVLHYRNPGIDVRFDLGGGEIWGLETCWWVPLLFGVAGVIIGAGLPALDELAAARSGGGGASGGGGEQEGAGDAAARAPGWPAVLACISLFVAQYWWSGELQGTLLGAGGAAADPSAPAAGAAGALRALGGAAGAAPSTWPVEDGLLLASAVALWAAFDRTAQGAFMAALTAVCGPAVEIFLINVLQLYDYTHPQIWGVPTWIPWVYAAGGPAVGGLGRQVWAALKERRRAQSAPIAR